MEAEIIRISSVSSHLTALGRRSVTCLIISFIGMSLLPFNYVLYSCLRYKIYDLPNILYTKPVWNSVNPRIEETVHFAALGASLEFLNYLLTNALIVDLWGLQGMWLAQSFLWSTVQPDLMLQEERREAGGSLWSHPLPGSWVPCGSPHLTRLRPAETPFVAGLSHTAEGCVHLGFSQLDVLLTGEGHIMVDSKNFSNVKNVSQVCTRQLTGD